MSRQLIVNADDYGRAPCVSKGILQAHREGIVTSTTVMSNQPRIEAQAFRRGHGKPCCRPPPSAEGGATGHPELGRPHGGI